jgi:dTDP-4-amino-4,6-dideoxygalactose transaminase
MSPLKLEEWLKTNAAGTSQRGAVIDQATGRPIAAIVPMHTFGHPCRIDEIKAIADTYRIPLIEDSAESLGSYYKGKHTGTYGLAGILSYNGNKTITTGGGGMIITNDETFAARARHITTTAKVPHRWEYVHDEAGYNFRLTNVNAAIGVAQMEKITEYLQNKRQTAEQYAQFCRVNGIGFITEPKAAVSNYWLNAIVMENREERDAFLAFSNDKGVMTRPIWRLMNKLEMYKDSPHDDLTNSQWLEDRIVNIPSGVRI